MHGLWAGQYQSAAASALSATTHVYTQQQGRRGRGGEPRDSVFAGMKTIKTIIVDDEPLARRNLQALLKADPEIEIIAVCAGGAEAVKLIRRTMPDLLFLDVQMPETDGFAVLKKISTVSIPAIVFVTAHDQYA